MADPKKQSVQDLVDQAIQSGVPEEEVIGHLSKSSNPEHKAYLAQYHAKKAKEFGGDTEISEENQEPDIIDEAVSLAKKHPLATAGVVGTVVGAPILAYKAKKTMDINAEVEKAKRISELEPTEAVKIQRDQFIAGEKQKLLDAEREKEIQAHQAQLRQEELAQAQLKTQQAQAELQLKQSKLGKAPPTTGAVSAPTDPVAIAQKASGPVTPANADINAPAPTVNTAAPALPTGPAAPVTPNPTAQPTSAPAETQNVSQDLINHILGKESGPPEPTSNPVGQQIPNPPASGDEAHPLTNPGEEAGKTPLEATTQATEDKTDYENLFRETPKENPINEFANVATEAKLKEGMEHPATPQETLERVEGLHPQLKEHLKTQAELLKGNKKFENAVRTSEKLKSNEVFVPGYGNMDRKMHKDLGPELKREALSKVGEGTSFGEVLENPIASENPKGSTFGKKNSELNAKFREVLSKENRQIPTYEELKAEGKTPATVKSLGRAMKIGGVAGTAILLSDLANASTPQQAKEAQRNLGESLLPIGATPTPIESGTLPKNVLEQYKEYGKLGSPYREAFLKQTGKK